MQKNPLPLGDRFVDLGLITDDDVRRALDLQRERGGFFGDALIELGLLTPDQVRWGLADQFDIPFVQIRPEHIDPRVAAVVPAAWAREHLILPVLRDGDSVTVVIADPTRLGGLDEVRLSTGAAQIEVALSPAKTIRELIAYVHGEANQTAVTNVCTPATTTARIKPSVAEWLSRALAAGHPRVGLSSSAAEVGWAGTREQSWHLPAGSLDELITYLRPAPTAPEGAVHRWSAVLTLPNAAWLLDCTYLRSDGTAEWCAQVRGRVPVYPSAVPVGAELRLAVAEQMKRGGAVLRVAAVDGDDENLAGVLLTAIPAALGTESGVVHVTDRQGPTLPGTLSVIAEQDLAAVLEALESISPSAITIDVERLSAADLARARLVAALVVFRARCLNPPNVDHEITLCLDRDRDDLVWELSPPTTVS